MVCVVQMCRWVKSRGSPGPPRRQRRRGPCRPRRRRPSLADASRPFWRSVPRCRRARPFQRGARRRVLRHGGGVCCRGWAMGRGGAAPLNFGPGHSAKHAGSAAAVLAVHAALDVRPPGHRLRHPPEQGAEGLAGPRGRGGAQDRESPRSFPEVVREPEPDGPCGCGAERRPELQERSASQVQPASRQPGDVSWHPYRARLRLLQPCQGEDLGKDNGRRRHSQAASAGNDVPGVGRGDFRRLGGCLAPRAILAGVAAAEEGGLALELRTCVCLGRAGWAPAAFHRLGLSRTHQRLRAQKDVLPGEPEGPRQGVGLRAPSQPAGAGPGVGPLQGGRRSAHGHVRLRLGRGRPHREPVQHGVSRHAHTDCQRGLQDLRRAAVGGRGDRTLQSLWGFARPASGTPPVLLGLWQPRRAGCAHVRFQR
mmetsp:Transcript_72339/g.215885  ORF Transcript_72339/g.215885 Transcript_72339/m.215885 type:complete len:423 (+) Transcript_72339:102-1370(+)